MFRLDANIARQVAQRLGPTGQRWTNLDELRRTTLKMEGPGLTEVMHDSVFYRRPPLPKVEEIQIQEYSQAEWESDTMPDLKPRRRTT